MEPRNQPERAEHGGRHPMIRRNPRLRSGFTLMELLVVVAIVVIVSAAALPVIRPALSQRKVSSAALIVQGEVARCRDEAIRANAPRGIRLLPSLDDQFKFVPYPSNASPTAAQLQAYSQSTPAYTRMVSIEPSPDYSSGVVCAKPVNFTVPFSDGPSDTDFSGTQKATYLRVQECLYNYVPLTPPVQLPNERANWYWNIRVGDKFRFHDSSAIYTVVGPVGLPRDANGNIDARLNPELYVNNDVSTPGDFATNFPNTPQFLYLVNGVDDDLDGFIDNSFDNVDNNYDGSIDPYPGLSFWPVPDTMFVQIANESELESFIGMNVTYPQPSPLIPVADGIDQDGDGTFDNLSEPDAKFSQLAYTIQRRPIPSPGSRIQELPTGTAIDMTAWTHYSPQGNERSRLPIDPRTGFIDILIAPNGMVMKADYNTTQPGPPMNFPFFHFWISDTDDIVTPNSSGPPYLPNPDVRDSQGRLLKGERRLVSINTRTGQIVTGSAENFSTSNINTPFFNVEHGIRDEQ
jgi:prepilin-type N-terminal cleavage/methylation domain-containing protein